MLIQPHPLFQIWGPTWVADRLLGAIYQDEAVLAELSYLDHEDTAKPGLLIWGIQTDQYPLAWYWAHLSTDSQQRLNGIAMDWMLEAMGARALGARL